MVMEIRIESLIEGARRADGTVVVIDVFRAFTTAAVAFARGVDKIILTAEPEEALALRERGLGDLCMGEVDGIRAPGFDFGNSPFELSQADVRGKTLIQSTRAGTVGVCAVPNLQTLYAASFVVAGATARTILHDDPPLVTLVAMGAKAWQRSDEDEQCALYLRNLLLGGRPDPDAVRKLVSASVDAAKFRNPELPHFHPGDLEIALDIDRYDFAIRVATENGLPVARAVGGQTGRAQPVDAAQPDAQLQMVWPEHLLSAPPAAPLPPGYTLRTYRPGDEPRFYEVMALAGWPGWDDEKLRPWLARIPPGSWFMVVHEASDQIVATAMGLHDHSDAASVRRRGGLGRLRSGTHRQGAGPRRQCRSHDAADRRGLPRRPSLHRALAAGGAEKLSEAGVCPLPVCAGDGRALADDLRATGLAIHAGSVAVIRVRKRTGSAKRHSRESGNPGTTAGHPPSRV